MCFQSAVVGTPSASLHLSLSLSQDGTSWCQCQDSFSWPRAEAAAPQAFPRLGLVYRPGCHSWLLLWGPTHLWDSSQPLLPELTQLWACHWFLSSMSLFLAKALNCFAKSVSVICNLFSATRQLSWFAKAMDSVAESLDTEEKQSVIQMDAWAWMLQLKTTESTFDSPSWASPSPGDELLTHFEAFITEPGATLWDVAQPGPSTWHN